MKELRTVVDFLYFGEVTVREVDLQLFYEAAKQLQIFNFVAEKSSTKIDKRKLE